MVTGVLGAAAQNELRRILSFHIISQIGYMILGLALYTPLGIVGAVFYLVHHIIVKANLFFVSGVVNRIAGSFELNRLGDLYRYHPLIAVLFFIPAFSLAGFPPLSGFWAKFVLVQASLEVEGYIIAAVALAVGLLTIYSMTKIWLNAFWKARPAEAGPPPPPLSGLQRWCLLGPIAVLAAMTVTIGLFVEPFYQLAERSAEELLNPQPYVEAVLGEDGLARMTALSLAGEEAGVEP